MKLTLATLTRYLNKNRPKVVSKESRPSCEAQIICPAGGLTQCVDYEVMIESLIYMNQKPIFQNIAFRTAELCPGIANTARTNYRKTKNENMDSSHSNSLPPLGGQYLRLPKDGGSQDAEELNRVKIQLQQVTKKSQDLEEKLLLATRELEKERENSRAIVLTLTERLMELKETINKLEVDNMRYKKDCMLSLELLQCNRSDDQAGRVSSVMKKLSDYSPKSKASKNADEPPTTNEAKGSQSTTKNANETSLKGKGVFQRPNPWRAVEGKSNPEKVASVKTSPTREKGPQRRAMHVNEASRLIPDESLSVRDNVPLVDSSGLSEDTGDSMKEGIQFAKDKPRLTEGKQSVPALRPRGRGQDNKYTPLMQDNVASIKQEDTSLVEKETPFGEGDKVMEKPTEKLREEITSTHFSTEKEQPQPQEDKKLSTQNEKLEDEHAQLIKEECVKKLREPNVDKPLDSKPQCSEAALDDTQDNVHTKAEPGVLPEENKPTADYDRTLRENEELFNGGTTEVGILKEGGEESSTDATVLVNGTCVQQGNSVAEESDALPADEGVLLAENGKRLIEEVGGKSLVGQVLTEEKYENSNNAPPADKETEDDTLAEEDTPLV